MACRSPIAGTVFAFTVPGLWLTVGALLGIATYGFAAPDVRNQFQVPLMWCGTLGLCPIGAVMGWRSFMRLEAIDGPGQDVRLPQWLSLRNESPAATLTRRHTWWLLAAKEFRLQPMTLVIAGLYVLGWIAANTLAPVVPRAMEIFNVLSFF